MTRVLFVTPNHEDYLGDGLLHGLRTILGEDVIDFPKAEFLYESYPLAERAHLYGHGFSLYCQLPDVRIDRNRVFDRALAGEFDLVVLSDIWRTFGTLVELVPRLPDQTRLAVIDGADRAEPYPYAGLWWREPIWWTLPRAHRRGLYFKREITPATGWFRSYLTLPPAIAQHLPSIRAMREISFSFPEAKIVRELPSKDRLLISHIVDPEVAGLVGAHTSYAFDVEEEYYADMRRARFGIATKRAGWDSLRPYEQAANGCVPCFRDLHAKPPRCAPHGLDETNCVPYKDAKGLLARLEAMGDDEYAHLQTGALAWVRANSTQARARAFLAACGVR